MSLDIEDFKKKFEPMIVQKMTNAKIPGSAYTVFQDETIIYSRGFGSRDLANYLPYTPDTLNGFGSNSKSFTALAIMLLQEEGKLSIEDPISKYIPVTLGKENEPIKIKHLLSHSSGIPNLGNAEILITHLTPDLGPPLIPFSSWEDVWLHINGANAEIRFNPGEHFYYFNNGYVLLGEIVARVSGMAYEDFIKEKIIKKLGLERTGFLKSDFEHDGNISVPYTSDPKAEGPPMPKPGKFPFNKFIYAAGGLISSTNEMAKYIMMMMNKGKYKGNQLFSANIIDEMTTGRIKTTLPDPLPIEYGYGWIKTEDFLGDTLISHGGGITGGYSQMAYLQNAKIGITSITNFPPGTMDDTLKAFCFLFGKDPDEVFPLNKRNKHLSKLAGEYASYKDIGKRKISNENGTLYVSIGNSKEKFPLYPKSDNPEEINFYIQLPTAKMDVDFEIDEDKSIHFSMERNLFHKKS